MTYEARDIKVKPRVYLIDQWYYDADEMQILDGISVRWGRTGLTESASPATVAIRLLDPTGTWVQRMRDNAIIGEAISLFAGINFNTSTLTWEQGWNWFHGRITDVEIEDAPKDPETNLSRGDIVTISGVDRMAQWGNVVMYDHALPLAAGQTVITRANWIKLQALETTQITDVFFDPYFETKTCSETAVDGQSMQSIMDSFYKSMGHTYSYSPKDNVVRNNGRYNGTIDTSFYRGSDGYLHIAPAANPRPGAWGTDDDDFLGTSLGAQVVAPSGRSIKQSGSERINRLQMSYRDKVTGEDKTLVRNILDTGEGVRLMTAQTWLDTTSEVGNVAEQVFGSLNWEGSLPLHPEVTYDTRLSGDSFQSVVQAMDLIMAGERQYLVFIAGSPWTVRLDKFHPIFGVLGGSIEYRRGRWVITMQLQPYYHDDVFFGMDEPTWDDLPHEIEWGDEADTTNKLDHSIQWHDLKFVTDPSIKVYADEFPND
ncbi:hypothetical protein AAFP35_08255 [Gordonia sp. CPCC 206044]|uniref:hypothetical protein n=1 Tax=Gordonia sp. CPCC 206044 TaxID=3140793 RepID=UPI003AF3BE48